MNTTNKLRNNISTLIMIALSFLIIYLLHDISKAVVGLLCGGKIEFNQYKRDIVDIIKRLCKYKGVEIIE